MEKWLHGTVVNVIVKKPDGAKGVARFDTDGRDYWTMLEAGANLVK